MSSIEDELAPVKFKSLPAACPFDLFECGRRSDREALGQNLDCMSSEPCIPALKATRQISPWEACLVRKTVDKCVKFTASLLSYAADKRICLREVYPLEQVFQV